MKILDRYTGKPIYENDNANFKSYVLKVPK